MGDQSKQARFTRRTVLIAAAGAGPLLALGASWRQRREACPERGEISAYAQGRQTVRRLQALRRSQLMQVCRGRDRS